MKHILKIALLLAAFINAPVAFSHGNHSHQNTINHAHMHSHDNGTEHNHAHDHDCALCADHHCDACCDHGQEHDEYDYSHLIDER